MEIMRGRTVLLFGAFRCYIGAFDIFFCKRLDTGIELIIKTLNEFIKISVGV